MCECVSRFVHTIPTGRAFNRLMKETFDEKQIEVILYSTRIHHLHDSAVAKCMHYMCIYSPSPHPTIQIII